MKITTKITIGLVATGLGVVATKAITANSKKNQEIKAKEKEEQLIKDLETLTIQVEKVVMSDEVINAATAYCNNNLTREEANDAIKVLENIIKTYEEAMNLINSINKKDDYIEKIEILVRRRRNILKHKIILINETVKANKH